MIILVQEEYKIGILIKINKKWEKMKYEYNQIYISSNPPDHRETLNKMGEKGWELITAIKCDNNVIMYLFKRNLEKLITE